MFINYYQILEIDENASFQEIKSSYNKLAFKWHPDKNLDSDTTIQMQLINEAYLILKDSEARERYNIQFQRYKQYQTVNNSSSNNQKENHNNDSTVESNFESNDEILNKWIENAKKQAKEIVEKIMDEFKGSIKEGAKSIGSFFWYLIPFILGYLFIRGCNML